MRSLTDLAAGFIDSPLMVLMLLSVAFSTAAVLVRLMPSIRHTIVTVETNRHKAIDGLRGFLGVGVFIHHTVITWFFLNGNDWKLPQSRLVVHLGQTSVALFFMITAFLFWSRVLARGRNIDWAEFFVSRLYRLYPAYLLMVGLVVLATFILTWSGPPVTTGSFVKSLLHWLLFTMFGMPELNGWPNTGLLVAWVTWQGCSTLAARVN